MPRESYPELFEPLTIKRMTIKNRVSMAPMGTNFAESDGQMSPLHMDYYEQRAQGGVGLIIMENACVEFPEGSNGTTQLRIDSDNYIPRLYQLCERVHQHGACISVQINHAGASTMASRIGMQPISASNIPSKPGGEIPRPATAEDLERIAKAYGASARRAQIAGFDCVEIHAGHGYLISQFLSPLTNDRTDEFGGSAENRARFCKMVAQEVRGAVGPDYPVLCRVSADEMVEGGNDIEDTLELLQYFIDDIDLIDVSCALPQNIQYQLDTGDLKDGWRSYMAREVREHTGLPVITTGNIRSPRVAEAILEAGDADLIGIGRGLIADPNWVNKVQHGQRALLRKCISCNIGCAGHRLGLNAPIRCTVNPYVNLWEDIHPKVSKPCNVVVIGGGTAGLEAACTAAEAGCQTFLYERNAAVGGLAAEICKIPGKERIADFVRYQNNRAATLDSLYVFTGLEPTVKNIAPLKPAVVVNATGSDPLLPPIDGLRDHLDLPDGHVHSIIDMIDHVDDFPTDMTGKKVVVVGGGAVGLDVVEFCAPRGANVTIVEMLPQIGRDLDPVSKAYMGEVMQKHHVRQMTETALQKVNADHFTVKLPDGTVTDLPFDEGFVCLGMKSRSPHLEEIEAAFADTDVEIINIGDAKRARRIIEGVQEGHNILKVLRRLGYLPRTFE